MSEPSGRRLRAEEIRAGALKGATVTEVHDLRDYFHVRLRLADGRLVGIYVDERDHDGVSDVEVLWARRTDDEA